MKILIATTMSILACVWSAKTYLKTHRGQICWTDLSYSPLIKYVSHNSLQSIEMSEESNLIRTNAVLPLEVSKFKQVFRRSSQLPSPTVTDNDLFYLIVKLLTKTIWTVDTFLGHPVGSLLKIFRV